MKNNQNGFGLVEVVIIALIVCLLGFSGWYAYDKSVQNKQIDTVEPTSKPVTETTFVSKEFGFSFVYPKGFGEGSGDIYETTEEVNAITGKSYTISVADKIAGGFVTKDFTIASVDKNLMPPGFTKYQACKPDENVTKQIILIKEDSYCVVINGSEEIAPGSSEPSKVATMQIQYNFTKNKKIAGIEVTNSPVVVKDFSESSLKSAFSGPDQETFINFAQSIYEI